MTERLDAYPPYQRASPPTDEGLSNKKTALVLVVVVGCFAILWPKILYPMLVQSANNQMKPGPIDKTSGCCDVFSELDIDTLKIMSELCSTIIDTPPSSKTPPPKEMVTQCKKAVLETCGIDISAALQDRISLGHSVKQILDEVRSLNGSLCLKYHFGVAPWKLGVPHLISVQANAEKSIRQERPTYLRSEMIHPAFKERGRAIPQSEGAGASRKSNPPPRIVEGRPGPIPGMRPAMGGPGHVVPPPKQSNYGFMGVLMPIYTVGFVVFFTYTIMKLVFKKKTDPYVGAALYPECDTDDQFHKDVFDANRHYFHRPNKDNSKIVVNAVSALLEEVNHELEARKNNTTTENLNEQDEITSNGPIQEEQGSVTVMGMETTLSSESGKKWSRPDSPVLPHPPPVVVVPQEPPPQIFLEGSLPPQSQILVADSATERQKQSSDNEPVVLAGKMTLSVISLDSENGTDESSSNSGNKAESPEEERRTSSEEFEKINAVDLEEQIDNIIEEAENTASNEEKRYSLSEELENFTEQISHAPQIDEKTKHIDVLEEIKNQFNLEDDLIKALSQNEEPEGKISLPVTDIIKEFLNNEENALLEELVETKKEDEPTAVQLCERNGEEAGEQTTAREVQETELMSTEDKDGAPETSVKSDNRVTNNADLLLQGLLVKEDEEITNNVADVEDNLPAYDVDAEEDDVVYEERTDNEDLLEDEIREVLGRYEDRESEERRVNGDGSGGEMEEENELFDNEDVENEDEEIEEIIEYVDDTDEEGEEIVEVNANEQRHQVENGEN